MFLAHAKVNLFLDVTVRRPDGYHDILSVFQEISLSDSLTVHRSRTPGLRLLSRPAIPGNILDKTWSACDSRYGPLPGIRAVLKKKIPLGAGLGGGSSDAASFLKALRKIAGFSASETDLERLGAEIGSDVPFFVRGGCQTAAGRGEILSSCVHKTRLFLVLVHPGFPVATAEAYGRLSPSRFGLGRDRFRRLQEGLIAGDTRIVAENMYNVFEETVFADFPGLPLIAQKLREHGALNTLLSGSGSTVFGLFPDPRSAKQCVRRLERDYPFVRTAEENP